MHIFNAIIVFLLTIYLFLKIYLSFNNTIDSYFYIFINFFMI